MPLDQDVSGSCSTLIKFLQIWIYHWLPCNPPRSPHKIEKWPLYHCSLMERVELAQKCSQILLFFQCNWRRKRNRNEDHAFKHFFVRKFFESKDFFWHIYEKAIDGVLNWLIYKFIKNSTQIYENAIDAFKKGDNVFSFLGFCPKLWVGGGSKILNFLVKIHIQLFLMQTSRNVLKHIIQKWGGHTWPFHDALRPQRFSTVKRLTKNSFI